MVNGMPMYGWNVNFNIAQNKGSNETFTVPGGPTITEPCNSHTGLLLDSNNQSLFSDGAGFRFFLDPVVQGINYFQSVTPNAGPVSMIGLSGGGWTTSMAAAVDTRIKLSVPVAGSEPLYCRNADPASIGDTEQYYAPMYDENIAPDGSGGGVATWLEIYALGGYGEGRRQIMVTNLYDYYFSGTSPTASRASFPAWCPTHLGRVSGITFWTTRTAARRTPNTSSLPMSRPT